MTRNHNYCLEVESILGNAYNEYVWDILSSCNYTKSTKSLNSVVGRETRLCDGLSTVQIPAKMSSSSPKCPDWQWGPHSILFSGYQGSFLRLKQPWHKAYDFLPYNTEVKNELSYSLLPLYAIMVQTGTY